MNKTTSMSVAPFGTTEHVRVPGGELFVRHWRVDGASGAPILLLHDSLGSVEQWRTFPQALAARTSRPVIAYDRLGFGRSSPQTAPARASFIDDEARCYLPAVVAALGLEHYIVLGHSVGGGMAVAAAASAGPACVAVITESAQAFVEEKTLAGIREAKRSFEDPSQFARLEKWHGERAAWVLSAWTDIWLSSSFRDWSLSPYLKQVQCPVLALHGDADEFGSSAFAQAIVQGVAGPAQMKILAGCGHVPHREMEATVLDHVQAFLRTHRVV